MAMHRYKFWVIDHYLYVKVGDDYNRYHRSREAFDNFNEAKEKFFSISEDAEGSYFLARIYDTLDGSDGCETMNCRGKGQPED